MIPRWLSSSSCSSYLFRVADSLVYPLQRIGFEQFRVCDYLLPRSVQIFQYVIQRVHRHRPGELFGVQKKISQDS